MASFAIFSDTTAPQTLEDGETAFIAAGASLSVDGDETSGSAIFAQGSNNIVVFGTVISHNAGLIRHMGSSLDLYVGAEGMARQLGNTAVFSSFTSSVSVTNDGTISATGRGLELLASDGSGSVDIFNDGLISGSVYGIVTDLGTGTTRITNSGVIEGDSAGAISIASGDAVIANYGEITTAVDPGASGKAYFGASGTDTFDNFGSVIGGIHTNEGNDVVTNEGTVDQVSLGNGDDLFDGRGGTVTGEVAGGRGSDVYRIDQTAITLIELAGQGTDQVIVNFDYTLAENFENLKLTGGNDIDGTGNSAKNTITGNQGSNALKGFGKADTLNGRGGDDTLFGGRGDDLMNGGAGRDILLGGLGDDILSGGNGADVLIGGIGKDTLSGGAGSDRFVFSKAAHSLDAENANNILDFEIGSDRIDLSDLIAGEFTFIANGFFSGDGPEIRAVEIEGRTIVRIDVDGDQIVDMKIKLADVSGLQASDFIL